MKPTNCRFFSLLLLTFAFVAFAAAQNPYFPNVLPMRERAEVIDRLLEERVQTVLPPLMKRTGIDMWIIISREYNEDPVLKTFLPSTWQSARRTTILVIHDPGDGKQLGTYAMARYAVGKMFVKAWDKEKEPDQWKALAKFVAEKNPKRIGVNRSATDALADGISAFHFDRLIESLSEPFRSRVTTAENLAIGWLETRTESEMAIYPNIVRMAKQIIAEGFSEKVIQPGVTTTDDVVWWYRERIKELKLETWFHPSVSVQRKDPESFEHLRAFSDRPEDQVILPGDLLHVDFGITYLRLNTDTQQHAYVLRPGETEPPAFLKEALKKGNRVQDILTGNFRTGRTGNQILAASLAQCKAENIKCSIYTHPLGFHGHAAGTTIGLWDQQEGVPVAGDYPLYPMTAHSIELNAASYIEEWGKEIRIMLEEDAFFDGTTTRYIDGRQTELMVIPRPLPPNR
ncbi:MAG: M24 family metallopeptidase [Acidobacteriota bacterium]|nr:MAG: M24 family metallopeptidase [Acidobacteriota bacterium]